jgi:pyruvate dehydrogenase (quinone)
VVTTVILSAVVDKGPTVISMPGDIASANAPDHSSHEVTIPAPPVFRPADADLDKLAEMIKAANKIAIFGGDGDDRSPLLARVHQSIEKMRYTWAGASAYHHGLPLR